MPLISIPPVAPSPPRDRLPAGYRGINHETCGSDILAVVEALHFPHSILGAARMKRLEQVQRDGWYPIAELLEVMDVLDRHFGADGLRKLGRTIIRMSHAKLANDGVMCPRDFLNNVDRMYRLANRGTDIGGWALVSFSATRVELRKTTVHHCHMEEGIVMQVMEALRAPCRIEQTRCFRRGDDHCLFVLTPALASQPFEGPGR